MGKPIGIIVTFIVTILFIVTFINIANQSQKYTLTLPDIEAIQSVVISNNIGQKEESVKEIKDDENIQKILKTLKGTGRKSKEESVQDAPVNAKNVIKVDFNHAEGGTSTVFVYARMPKYYIEQPYNGIYKISIEDFNAIDNYVR